MEVNKLSKKVKRKLLQLSQKLPNNCTLVVSTVPTTFVLVGNGGSSSGVSTDLLTSLLKQSTLQAITEDDVVDIHTAPNCDSPIVELKDTKSSEIVLNSMNGQCVQDMVGCNIHDLRPLVPDYIMADSHPPLHLLMAYVSQVPDVFNSIKRHSKILEQSMFPPGCHLLDNFISEDEEILLLKHFCSDFTRIADSLKQCKQWEQSMRNEPNEEHNNSTTETFKGTEEELQKDNMEIIKDHSTKDDDDNALGCHSSQFTHLKLRTVHHYGYEFLYGTNTVDPATPLPGGLPHVLNFLVERIMKTGLLAYVPDQLTINEYEPGAGIPRHVDTHSAFKDGICIVTLGSHTVMQFQCNADGNCEKKIDVVLPRKSLLVMKGESRYSWTHCIPARKSDTVASSTLGMESFQLGYHFNHLILQRFIRVSLTLRKIHCSPCDCGFPEVCDHHA